MSYGKDLPNTHLIQKYGFTIPNNPSNALNIQLPYRDYQSLLFEEKHIK